jgi:hypothetical protein
MEVRDLFIKELNDRYPGSYATVELKIQQLHELNLSQA